MEQNTNPELTQLGIGAINNDTDFWADANEFLKSQLPPDFQDKLKEYISVKGYNKNEFRLFSTMLKEVIGLDATIASLKHY